MTGSRQFIVLLVSNGRDTVTEAVFAGRGCAIRTASPGELAAILREIKIDLALLDIDLLKEKAISVSKVIRRLDKLTPIAATAASYKVDRHDIEIELRLEGVFACRGKPLSQEEAQWLVESAKGFSRNHKS